MIEANFKGMYEINDGYAGGARPQYFSIPAGHVEDDLTDGQLEDLYEEIAEECFRENIGITTRRKEAFVLWAREQITKRGQQ